jgi:Icc-related predicted phosphoesterase
MKILFSSDLHGQERLYAELLSLAHELGSDCLLLGGDLLPTRLSSLSALVSGGFDFNAGLRTQIDFIEATLAPLLNKFMDSHPGAHVFYIPGNHDWIAAMKHLAVQVPRAVDLHLRQERLDGYRFVGYACVTDSSFWVKDYVRRDTPLDGHVPSRYAGISTPRGIEPVAGGAYMQRHPSIQEELAGMGLDDPGHTICLFHSPPFNTGLDTLHDGRPIGSRAIRAFITERQPLITLHGHIHESPFMSGIFQARIGRTLCVNAGHGHKRLHAVSFDPENPAETLAHSLFGSGDYTMRGYGLDCLGLKIKALVLQSFFSK